jgi:hypothetical protein
LLVNIWTKTCTLLLHGNAAVNNDIHRKSYVLQLFEGLLRLWPVFLINKERWTFENFSRGEGVSHEPLDGFEWLYRRIVSIS